MYRGAAGMIRYSVSNELTRNVALASGRYPSMRPAIFSPLFSTRPLTSRISIPSSVKTNLPATCSSRTGTR